MNRAVAFLLKVGDGSAVPSYATVAGLKTTSVIINGEPVTTEATSGWRELISGAGVRSVDIAANGIFVGSAAEHEVRLRALNGSADDYELSFASGERLRGHFQISRLEYAGDFNGERNYAITLVSSGEVTPL